MIHRINFAEFCDAFVRHNRGDQFSREALSLIFDHLEDMDEDYELDVIAICCDFSEVDLDDIVDELGDDVYIDREDYDDDDEYNEDLAQAVQDELEKQGTFVGMTENNTFVVMQ